MINSDNHEVRRLEIQDRLMVLDALSGDGFTDDLQKENEGLLAELKTLGVRKRTSLKVEGAAADAAQAASDSGEGREHRELVRRSSLRSFLIEASTGREVDGASKELRDAVMGKSSELGRVPWEILLPPALEARADVATSAPTSTGQVQRSIVGRVFVDTTANSLGVSMADAGVGDAVYTIISAGATGKAVPHGVSKDAQAATLEASVLEPIRLQARYRIRTEDLHRLSGQEDALRADLRGVLGEALDNEILNGDGTTTASKKRPSGFLKALAEPSPLPSDVASYQSLLEGSAKAVDGRYARSLLQTRTVFGPATWQLAASLSGNAGDVTASDYLSMRSAGLSVSALIPAEDGTTKIQAALVSKLGAPNSAVAPVWGLELLSDPYSLASSGERLLTAFLYFNFKVIRADGFSRLAFKVA